MTTDLQQRLEELERRVERLERGTPTYGPGPNAPKFTPPPEWERARATLAAPAALAPPEPVDRSALQLTDGGPVTTDYRDIDPATGQQKGYVVLTAEERAKGFVRPVRRDYVHVGKDGTGGCGTRTVMAQSIAETYARDPSFYNGTFCVGCRAHFPLDQFVWDGTTEIVGS